MEKPNWILEYWREIESGRTIVSARVRKVYGRLANEITSPDPESPWRFDVGKANDPIEFIQLFCRQSHGEWIGRPLQLGLFQKAYISALFGFVGKVDGMRRYNETLFVIGRKNGKSTLASGLAAYMLIADGEGGAEIYSVATKKDQARIVFKESVNMVRQSPDLSRRIKKHRQDLAYEATFSKFEALASDSNTLDGLNTHLCIMDELHAIKDRSLYEVMKQSMSARRQPLLMMITTAGTIRECIYDEMYEYGCRVADGEIEDEAFLPIIYELDRREEWTDPACWMKANPGLGTIKKLKDLQQKVARAKNNPTGLPGVLTKDFNIRETSSQAWLTYDQIKNPAAFDLEKFRGMYAIGGADLSSTTDLSCVTLIVMRRDDPVKYVVQHYFMPEETLESHMREDGRVPYDLWNQQGMLTLCPGNKVRFSDLTDWFWDLHKTHGIHPMKIHYDPWSSQYWIDEMIERFGDDVISDGKQGRKPSTGVRQGSRTLSQPMKELGADLCSKLINYNDSPILTWNLTNVAIKQDVNGNIQPVKIHQRMRIDGAVSLLIAYTGLLENWQEYRQYLKAG